MLLCIQCLRVLKFRIIKNPATFQPKFTSSKFKMAHGNAYINALEIGEPENIKYQCSFAITFCSLKIKMPCIIDSNYTPWLLIGSRGAQRTISIGSAYSPIVSLDRELSNDSAKNNCSSANAVHHSLFPNLSVSSLLLFIISDRNNCRNCFLFTQRYFLCKTTFRK